MCVRELIEGVGRRNRGSREEESDIITGCCLNMSPNNRFDRIDLYQNIIMLT